MIQNFYQRVINNPIWKSNSQPFQYSSIENAFNDLFKKISYHYPSSLNARRIALIIKRNMKNIVESMDYDDFKNNSKNELPLVFENLFKHFKDLRK